MKNLFLSLPSEMTDSPFVQLLTNTLQEHGYGIVMPRHGMADDVQSPLETMRRCGLVLAIAEGKSANLYLEVGIAIGLRKPLLIVTSSPSELPWSLKNVNCVSSAAGNDYHTAQSILSRLQDLNFENIQLTSFEGLSYDSIIRLHQSNPQQFDAIDPCTFERAIRQWCEAKGYGPVEIPEGSDAGYDISMPNFLPYRQTLIDIRKYSSGSKVSVTHVRALLGVMVAVQADHGILISGTGFTRSAFGFAEICEPKVELWTPQELLSNMP